MNWKEVLAPAMQSATIQEVKAKLQAGRKIANIYPKSEDMFKPFKLCPFEQTRVVIIGDEPYNTPGTADGLAFSTKQEERPKVLEIIFKEIYRDLNIQYRCQDDEDFEKYFPTNDLTKWAENGFLLLNSSLSVEEGRPNSHKDLGWNILIETAINGLMSKQKQVVFLLWGKEAQRYKKLVKSPHIYLEAEHPSAEIYQGGNNGFYGCSHFSLLRDILPVSNGTDIFPAENLTHCFDKEKAKALLKKDFPMSADKMCEYIDKQLVINIPFNNNIYHEEIRKFEDIISTKY